VCGAYIEEMLRGEDWKKEIWDSARGDLALYNNWHIMRHQIVGDIHPLPPNLIRDSVYIDWRNPVFRNKLYAAAREYEGKVFGETSW